MNEFPSPPRTAVRFVTETAVPESVAPNTHYPDDPQYPGLVVASDPREMLERFRKHLKPITGAPIRIEGCEPFRFRFSQRNSRCVLEYTVHLADPDTGRRWDTWVAALLYADEREAQRIFREMDAASAAQEVPPALKTFGPVAFDPELNVVLEVFPWDRKLRTLPRVMAGSLEEIDAHLLARLGPGRWSVEHSSVEPVRYRTEVSAALRYTIQAREAGSSRTETRRCYLKVYRDDARGEEAFQFLRSLSSLARPGRAFSLMGPIAYLPSLRAMAVEEAPGQSLSRILREVHDPVEAVRRVARAVAAFNQEPLAIPKRRVLADDLRSLARAADLVAWACPPAAKTVRAITDTVVQGLYEVPPGPSHGDLKADHIFVSEDAVTFIDLDEVALGDPVRDAAHVYAYLLAGIGLGSTPPFLTTTVAAAFLEEYFHHVPREWRRRFPLHCSAVLIEVASAIFRRQEPDWADKVAALVEATQHGLANWSGAERAARPRASRRTWIVSA